MNFAVILAAGSGSRMGLPYPKQFAVINDKPIIIHSLEHFVIHPEIDVVITAVPQEYIAYTKSLTDKYFPNKKIYIIGGGKDRSGTLKILTDYIFNGFEVNDKSVIITHDGVRPFIDSRIISENIAAARNFGACNTVIPATDTILRSRDGEYISEVFERTEIFHAQTPQSFNAIMLKQLTDNIKKEQLSKLTDGCSLFVLNDLPVKLVMGKHENIKITYPSDLKFI